MLPRLSASALPAIAVTSTPRTPRRSLASRACRQVLEHRKGLEPERHVRAAEKTTARPVEPIGSAPCSAARLFTTFLRDGRATTIEGAILAQFAALAEEEKAKLVAFLRTL